MKHTSIQICHLQLINCTKSFKIIFKKNLNLKKNLFFRRCRILSLFLGLKIVFHHRFVIDSTCRLTVNVRLYLPIQQSQARATTRPAMIATSQQPNCPPNDKKLMKFELKTPNGVVTVTNKSHCFFLAIVTDFNAQQILFYTQKSTFLLIHCDEESVMPASSWPVQILFSLLWRTVQRKQWSEKEQKKPTKTLFLCAICNPSRCVFRCDLSMNF